MGLGLLKQSLRCAVGADCRLCGQYRGGDEVCSACAALLAKTPWGVSSLNCADIRIPVLWREAYGGPLTELVYQSKYHGHWAGARLLGQCLGSLPRPWLGDPPTVVPIPLSAKRLANRGYNQSLEIARQAARHWGLKVKSRWLKKTHDTQRQASLGHLQRRANLGEAFQAAPACSGRRIILIDDIMTSGATMREAVRAIGENGGEVIAAAVIARVIAARSRPRLFR